VKDGGFSIDFGVQGYVGDREAHAVGGVNGGEVFFGILS
jgi:hypothetical protein